MDGHGRPWPARAPAWARPTSHLPARPGQSCEQKLICWSGTSGNFAFLYKIEKQIKTVLDASKGWKLRIISNQEPNFEIIDKEKIDFIHWSPDNEISSIAESAIGIMPLSDNDWTKGKCSFKMLQYMACGLPVVVSNVGMNIEVLSQGSIGFGIKSLSEWYDGLLHLINDQKLRSELGYRGRKVVVERYGIKILSEKLVNVIHRTYL